MKKIDRDGNVLSVDENGNITLKLLFENRTRKIGKLKKINGITTYFKKNRVSNIYKKTNSWGIHWEILDSLEPADIISISDDFGCYYHILVKDALSCGDFLHFKKEGFEKQFFIPIENFSNTEDFKNVFNLVL